jgi:hypothetical protein
MAFPVGESVYVLVLGADQNRAAWFGNVDGHWNVDNPARVSFTIANGRTYQATIKVRQGGNQAYLDGQLLCRYRTDGNDLEPAEMLAHSARLLAMGGYRSEVRFDAIEVAEISGRGTAGRCDASGSPICEIPLAPDDQGRFTLSAFDAMLHGELLRFEREPRNLGYWSRPEDYPSWVVNVRHPGEYAARLTYSCKKDHEGSDVAIGVEGGKSLPLRIVNTDTWENSHTDSLGTLTLPAGRSTITVKCVKKAPGPGVMNLWKLTRRGRRSFPLRTTLWRICRRYEQGGAARLFCEASRGGSPPRLSPPPAGADRGAGLPGTYRPRPAHHPLGQRRSGSPGRP